jgi:hypothetical protein
MGAFVEVRRVAEAERRVPRVELLRALEEADDLAVLGIRGHPVPESRREGRRAGLDDRMEPIAPRAIRFRSGISAIVASTALSPSALPARGPRRASAFSSWARSFIAARSSSVNPLDVLLVAVVLLADFCVPCFAGFRSAIAKHLLSTAQRSPWMRIRCRRTHSLASDVVTDLEAEGRREERPGRRPGRRAGGSRVNVMSMAVTLAAARGLLRRRARRPLL